jgi:DNA processing protein
VAHFGSPEKVLDAESAVLKKLFHLKKESLESMFGQGRKALEAQVAEEIARAAERGIIILPYEDSRYPALLKEIHDPPPVLYVYGSSDTLNCSGIGLVGSRAATRYGRDVAGQLGSGLALQGFTIVSGLALGIDTAAHQGAIGGGGKTLAVLGCGLDVIYPYANRNLYKKVAENGAVISEYPLGTKPESFRFPARNRIISGLSLGVVVVEAALRSGSLITANHALEQGREVFAVPGRIDSVKSGGTHTLLQQGAKLVHSISDIVEEFTTRDFNDFSNANTEPETAPQVNLSCEEGELFSILDTYPCTFDQLAEESGYAASKLNELLLHLELKGMIEALPGRSFRKVTAIEAQ